MAATAPSTTVDLSRLPAPTIVPLLGYETILAAMVAKMREFLPSFDATVDSDPAVKVLQVAAYHEVLIRQAGDDAGKQLLVAYATGANLDHLAALVGVPRLSVTDGTTTIPETDDALRQRIVLAPEGFSVAGPELAYVKHAKDASGDVLDASATSPAPGEVLVSVLSRIGSGVASSQLLDAVRAIVTDPAIRPLGDAVTVASANILSFEIVAALLTLSGPDTDLILTAARAALVAYLADSRKLGRAITRVGITAALKVAGVIDVDLQSPVASIACDLSQAGNCTAITIRHGGYTT
ncbi:MULTISPECIES: baseplate J/gp47 family protein [unclassified Sphingomonas]|uniref:baseplate assembly protein n=1 Tax=unclassified Sphingomonas TaxID=196159 RepID=UPI0006F2C822|nr:MULTISPECIES: baseplate J/gp47 family protein [unclassified Sphingomonas]KQN28513.1 hypothetical protein ASF00_10600 [Sphingomonas sp. Leaf34]KQN29703.1 hypothetical protein ASE88_12640 [Sphingomonas sp. Leaf38]